MSEVTFAKTFLATLDKRPIKLAAEHVSDPRKYPSQSPFILPRQPHPFPRQTVSSSTQQSRAQTVTASVKPMRGGETITISDLTLDSTIHDVKTQYAQKSSQAQDKIKLLLNKKPAADLKSLKDLGVSGETVELSAMIMGGAGGASTPGTATPPPEKSAPTPPIAAPVSAPVAGEKDAQMTDAPDSEKAQAEADSSAAAENAAADILKTDGFWDDLHGFLAQRLRDEKQADKLTQTFREAWKKA